MRSPIVAMLWENWRLTRFEAGARLVLTLVAAVAFVLATGGMTDDDAHSVLMNLFTFGIVTHGCIWISIFKLSGGKFMDGYRPGFPLYLLYTRPVRTAVFVAITMGYSAVMAAALYLAWAVPLRIVFDIPLPFVQAAAWVVALQLVQAASYWSTRSRAVQWWGGMGAFLLCIGLALRRADAARFLSGSFTLEEWSVMFDYSFVDYALIGGIALICFGLTVVGVARQRHGDTRRALPREATWTAPDWLSDLVRFPCPTSSATRAQLWFELRSSGLLVLSAGFVTAIVIPSLFMAGARGEFFRSVAFGVPVMSVLLLLLLGGNAFDIRRKQGHTYASIFDATQASRTGSMATLKVLTRSVTVLAALSMVAVSVWLSSSLMSTWPPAAPDAPNFQEVRDGIATGISTLRAWELAALAVIVTAAITILVTARASLEALFARYRARVVVVVGVLLLYVLAIGLSGMLDAGGSPRRLLGVVLETTTWIFAAGIALATAYLFWRAIAERLFTPLQAGIAVLVSAVFLAAWLTFLRATGVSITGMSMAGTVALVWPVVLPLLASVVAPWSLSRMRHS